uniref:Putative ovule protein n=1 Tax=Solanum chacoense TaxID=4108 RepID=A0A0V0GLB7_SOLCH
MSVKISNNLQAMLNFPLAKNIDKKVFTMSISKESALLVSIRFPPVRENVLEELLWELTLLASMSIYGDDDHGSLS